MTVARTVSSPIGTRFHVRTRRHTVAQAITQPECRALPSTMSRVAPAHAATHPLDEFQQFQDYSESDWQKILGHHARMGMEKTITNTRLSAGMGPRTVMQHCYVELLSAPMIRVTVAGGCYRLHCDGGRRPGRFLRGTEHPGTHGVQRALCGYLRADLLLVGSCNGLLLPLPETGRDDHSSGGHVDVCGISPRYRGLHYRGLRSSGLFRGHRTASDIPLGRHIGGRLLHSDVVPGLATCLACRAGHRAFGSGPRPCDSDR